MKTKCKVKKRSGAAALHAGDARQAKKARYIDVAAQRLPWQRTAGISYELDDFASGGDGGMMELEEVDDVDVVWEATPDGGKVVRFKMKQDKLEEKEATLEDGNDEQDTTDLLHEVEEWTGFSDGGEEDIHKIDNNNEAPVASTSRGVSPSQDKPAVDFEIPFDDQIMPEYEAIYLLPSLKRGLHALGFNQPTRVQQEVFSSVLAESRTVLTRDVVCVAETGSGKTLAYSIPILQDILNLTLAEGPTSARRPISALILCPTRELALQVRQHIGDLVYRASIPPQPTTDLTTPAHKPIKHIPRVNIVTICGGMSIQKQKRLLTARHGVDIIVATPGRLWDLMQDDVELAKQIKGIRFFVLDEADRMIENGHFAELDSIAALLKRKGGQAKPSGGRSQSYGKGKGAATSADPVDDAFEDDFENPADSVDATEARADLRTYVFSATMSKELQNNLKRMGNTGARKHTQEHGDKGHMGALGDLLAKLDFRDPDPMVVDLTTDSKTVATLKEVAVDCLLAEKDVYLYYFLLRYPGRTLVFFSSIDAIRRLQPLLALLGVNSAVLHSGMQQRARLKALDRFREANFMALLATDVAARGLDIPAVEHVIHYQLPRTADTYIHRSGRTARAGTEGVSVQLCAPEEKNTQRALIKALGRSGTLNDLSVDFSILSKLKIRIDLAKEIEVAQHRADKASHEQNWLRKAAEDMEIAYDSGDADSDQGRGAAKRKSAHAKSKEAELKSRLKAMLAEPLMKRGISGKYITAGGMSALANEMLSGQSHKVLLGLKPSRAVNDVR